MGQAKKKGSREERINQSLERQEREFHEREQRAAERAAEKFKFQQQMQAEYDALSPEGKDTYRKEHPERFRKPHIGVAGILAVTAMMVAAGMSNRRF